MPGTATLDVTVPNAARAYDYLLGGKEAYEADRQLVAAIEALYPDSSLPRQMALKNRVYQERAVSQAVHDGCRQVLVAGSGFPQPRDLHHVALEAAQGASCAYLDLDPVVASHGRVLTAETPGVTYAHGDLGKPGEVLADPDVRSVIDFRRPVCLVFGLVFHFRPAVSARRVVEGYLDALRPGSRVVITVPCWADAGLFGKVLAAYGPGEVHNHTPVQVQGWFRDLSLLGEGVEIARGLGPEVLAPSAPACVLAGVGRKG